MYNLWPILILSVALLIIIFIIFRHFPALAVLDVDNMAEEKERLIKEKIIRDRMKRKFSFLDKFFNNLLNLFNRLSNVFWSKLSSLQEGQKKKKEDKVLSEKSQVEQIDFLFKLADDFIKKENWSEAEKKLIEIITIDNNNFLAFLELGEVYHSEGKLQEAKQTLLYAVKLSENFSENINQSDVNNLNYSLALINRELNDIEGAILSLQKSLEVDANNPRYLDLMLDLCIIKKDKNSALYFLNKIKEVNPENNNIKEWEEQLLDLNNF